MAGKVVIYTTKTCPYCRSAKELLSSKKIAFEEIDVTHDEAKREELMRMSGQVTVPQIFADGRPIGGYQELARLFDSGKTL